MPRLSSHELANLIGELHAGRNPAWFLQTFLAVPPRIATDGIPLGNGDDGGAIATDFQIRVRRVAAYRTAIFQITEANTATYTISFDVGTGAIPVFFVADASATKEEIADGLKAAIEANGTLDANLLAFSEQDPTTGDFRLRVTGKPGSTLDADDFLIEGATATGAGALAVTADPNFCRVIFWGFPGGAQESLTQPADVNAFQPFSPPPDGEEETSPWAQVIQTPEPLGLPNKALQGKLYVHFGGYSDRLQTAGYARLAIQVVDITGPGDAFTPTFSNPRVIIGPARRESNVPIGTT